MTPVVEGRLIFLAAAVAAALWLLRGLLAEARDRVGTRFADWLFPLGLPLTYRLARGLLRLTILVAPRSELITERKNPYHDEYFSWVSAICLTRRSVDWEDLYAATAELEFAAQQDDPVIAPVHFVAPLLCRALRMRIANFLRGT